MPLILSCAEQPPLQPLLCENDGLWGAGNVDGAPSENRSIQEVFQYEYGKHFTHAGRTSPPGNGDQPDEESSGAEQL